MEVFTGASKVKIGKGNFSSVGKNQYNYYTTHNNIVQTRGKNKKVSRDLPELSEYTEIKRGDIYKSKDGVCYSWNLRSNGKDTEMAVYTAELNITGPFGQKKFTVKTYRGRNAMKEWRHDFSQCSKDWLRDVPLFGYDRSSVPSLIFSGELVPMAHMEGGLGAVGLFYIDLLKTSLGCSRNELWMDPTQGRFYRGPIGPKCRDWPEEDISVIVPSDAEFLKEDVIIRYFVSKEDDRLLLSTLGYSRHYEILDDIPTSHTRVISSLTNSTIAFYQNVRWRSSKGCLGSRRAIPAGTTRFRLRDDQRKIEVDSITEVVPWFAQALSVFHAHNISYDEDLSNYKLVEPCLELTGTIQKSKRKRQRRQSLDTPIYFVILPSPDPVYHWSLDPAGQTPLTPDMCKYLGLPFKLSLQATSFQESWPTKIYKVVHDYQIVRGFDPASTDFAQSLGFVVYDVVPAENRFEEIIEELHEMELVESGDSPLPAVRDDLEPFLGSNVHADSTEDLEGLDDSFSLALLFYEIEGSSNTSSSDASPAQTVNSEYTQQGGMVPSILGALFGSFTWEAVEGSGISAAVI
ncbi:hypothetical protein E1B28_011724 [Marasmius oreades]|uniref:Uncharacterized protein n=1 Tax=Marasmius oreades TaxID=181124 RepID=A0A9P7RVB6_9AGAR|nr:uncharacterized protein E1B28_011724 [Marasmius oreades]KAG7090113.1 hypothetical protein E1B28_011724 [Marasmius oreades]